MRLFVKKIISVMVPDDFELHTRDADKLEDTLNAIDYKKYLEGLLSEAGFDNTRVIVDDA
jgi:hypothetical protein